MALLDSESFDGWSTADSIARGWTTIPGSTVGAYGRFGTNGMYCLYDQFYTAKLFPAAITTGIVGVAMYHQNPALHTGVFSLWQGGFTTGAPQIAVSISSGGFIQVWRGNGATVLGTLLGTGTTSYPAGQYRYYECKFTIDNSAGAVEVRVNGVVELTLTGIDTQNGATSNVDAIRLANIGTSISVIQHFDDYYLCDTTGSKNNNYLGDVRVQNSLPNGNGNTSALDGSDGNTTDNYLLVDDPTAPDNETTYVESSDVGDKDTYAYQNLTPTAGTVYGVVVKPYARKTDAGVRNIAAIARLSGTEVDSSDILLPSNYAYFSKVYEDKPGGGDWTITDFNNAEFGVKVTA